MTDALSLTLDSDVLALDYEKISATRQFQTGKRLCADLAIGAGERVLDVGCGTGLLAGHIADLVGPTGFVLGLDPLPLRIELAKKRALFEAAGFTPATLEVCENEQRFATPEAAIRYSEASSFGNFLGHLPEEMKALARERAAERLAAIMGADGLVQQGRRLVAIGVKH